MDDLPSRSTVLLLLLLLPLLSSGTLAEHTPREAAAVAARVLRGTGVGTLAAVDPAGAPYATVEYYASCRGTPWDAHPLVFVARMAPVGRYVLADARAALAVRVLDARLEGQDAAQEVVLEDPAMRPMPHARVTLQGAVVRVQHGDDAYDAAMRCFLDVHPDARAWANLTDLAGHGFMLFQLRVARVHWVGGFGGAHYIGDLDMDVYEAAFAR